MKAKVCIVDTNIVVAGLISADPGSPPVQILDAMLCGALMYLMSAELLDEYSTVLHRPGVSKLHGLTADEIDTVLAELVANAIWREPVSATAAPDPGDDHLWALLASQADSVLVSGDKLLLENSPATSSVISARHYVELSMKSGGKLLL